MSSSEAPSQLAPGTNITRQRFRGSLNAGMGFMFGIPLASRLIVEQFGIPNAVAGMLALVAFLAFGSSTFRLLFRTTTWFRMYATVVPVVIAGISYAISDSARTVSVSTFVLGAVVVILIFDFAKRYRVSEKQLFGDG